VSTDRTQELLIDAAERLFAEHGFDGVTLKQITAEAGQRNASALQYHFGSKVELVRAIVARRMPALNERRNRLLDEVEAAGRAGDLRAVVEALVRPLGDVVRNDFNTGVVRGGLMAAALMGDLPPEVIRQRLTLLPGQVLHSFVDADRLLQANGKTRRGVSPFFLHGLIDMIVAELCAPVSAETRAALAARPAAAATEGGQRGVLP